MLPDIRVMGLHWGFLSALSIWLTVGIEESACIPLKVIARAVWLCCSDLSHSICSCLKQRADYPASDAGNETEGAEVAQLSSCRFLKLLCMLHYISVGLWCIEVPPKVQNWPFGFSFYLIRSAKLLFSTLGDSAHLRDHYTFSFSDLALLPEGKVGKGKGSGVTSQKPSLISPHNAFPTATVALVRGDNLGSNSSSLWLLHCKDHLVILSPRLSTQRLWAPWRHILYLVFVYETPAFGTMAKINLQYISVVLK